MGEVAINPVGISRARNGYSNLAICVYIYIHLHGCVGYLTIHAFAWVIGYLSCCNAWESHLFVNQGMSYAMIL